MRVLWLTTILLAGCAAAPKPGDPERFFADAAFRAAAPRIDPRGVFAPDDGMRAFAAGPLARLAQENGRERGLFMAMRDRLAIDYDATMTRTAAQTFAARSGNCLSLVILTGALAGELGVPVRYQRVYGHDAWSRASGIAFLSGHVNLILGNGGVLDREGSRALTIDFLETDGIGRRSDAHEIDQNTVVAMYLNNRAAETLAAGDVEQAYWWARAAVRQAPAFTSAYNTLGVVYLRHGDLAAAERVLRYADGREPANPQVLSNLARALDRRGKVQEAEAVRRELAAIEPDPPFYFLDAGVAALRRGDDEAALALFRKELRRMPYDDEVHFAIAVASLRLGKLSRARRHLELALENTAAPGRHDLYAAKLQYLRSLQRPPR